mmetsp:Transcript_32583/g.96943  ORF Transcript_32583/g.96943 Transcript_32583/m.96943 type:complete len:473 (-) Transcript_32583:328-1746(-)
MTGPLKVSHPSGEAPASNGGLGGKSISLAKALTSKVLKTVALNRERCKAILLDTTYQVRHQVLSNFRDLLKGSFILDPHTPVLVATYAERVIDMIWADIEEEIERDLEAAICRQLAGDEVEGPKGGCLCLGLLKIRAVFLHHYLPHNKSIWGKFKDPIYLVIFTIMLVPFSALHFCLMTVLLLMILLPGPPDEFQLLNFIMICKGLQFVSSGLLKCLKGSVVQFACYSAGRDSMLSCINAHGSPSATPLDLLLDYVGTILLTWFAASMLPRSKVHVSRTLRCRKDVSEQDEEEASKRRAGHRLHILLKYDLMCFGISLVLLAILTVSLCGRMQLRDLLCDPQFSSNIFWCSVLWSLSTLPFLPLNISWLFVAFSRSAPTGFNAQGACVGFLIPWKEPESESSFSRLVSSAKQASKAVMDQDSTNSNKATGDYPYGILYADDQKTWEEGITGGLVSDMVPSSPEHVMLGWDRF